MEPTPAPSSSKSIPAWIAWFAMRGVARFLMTRRRGVALFFTVFFRGVALFFTVFLFRGVALFFTVFFRGVALFFTVFFFRRFLWMFTLRRQRRRVFPPASFRFRVTRTPAFDARFLRDFVRTFLRLACTFLRSCALVLPRTEMRDRFASLLRAAVGGITVLLI